MNPDDISHLRRLLVQSMEASLAHGRQFEAEGRIALAAKFGGRAGGLESAIELLDMVAASPVKLPLEALSRASDPSKCPATTCAESQTQTRTDQPESSSISLPEAGLVEAASMMWGALMQMPPDYCIGHGPTRGAPGLETTRLAISAIAGGDVLPALLSLSGRVLNALAPLQASPPVPCAPPADRPSTASAAQVNLESPPATPHSTMPDAPIPVCCPFPSADFTATPPATQSIS